jgi:hypothetical protein
VSPKEPDPLRALPGSLAAALLLGAAYGGVLLLA